MPFLFLLLSLPAFSQTRIQKYYLRKGNKEYEQKQYDKAQLDYHKALDEDGKNFESNFNLGDALYKQQDYNGAAAKFESAASLAKSPSDKAKAFHNLGNSYLQAKSYQQSIDAYKEALKNNPDDKDTKYNLSYALAKLQQEQQKKNNKNQDKNNKNQQNQDKNGQGDKDKKDKDKNGQDKDKDKKGQDKDKQKDNQGDKDKDKQQGRKPEQKEGMSDAEAQRILDAIKGEEQKVQKRVILKNMKAKKGTQPEKQW